MPEPARNLATEEACAILGVSSSADEAELRAAYLRQVREHPPDRSPEQFEKIRDAFDYLRDPARRAALILEGPSFMEPLTSLLDASRPMRRFVGPELWIQALRENSVNEDESVHHKSDGVVSDDSTASQTAAAQPATGEPLATEAPAPSARLNDLQTLGTPPPPPTEQPAPAKGATTQASPFNDLEQPPQAPADDQRRARLRQQFESWLDTILQEEPPPSGIPDALVEQFMSDVASASAGRGAPAGNEADLYTLFAALTSLTGEIRLQGRAFKNLTDTLAPLSETPAQLRELQEAQRDATADILDALPPIDSAPHISTTEACEVLIDFYDRLARGLQTCAAGIRSIEATQRQTWLWRLAGGPVFAQQAAATARALQDASALTLARLQSVMQAWHIHRLGTVGETFDPQRMTVVDARIDPASPPGTVVEVIRSGYLLNGELRSVARVAVAKG